jgi:hypothetical protein
LGSTNKVGTPQRRQMPMFLHDPSICHEITQYKRMCVCV